MRNHVIKKDESQAVKMTVSEENAFDQLNMDPYTHRKYQQLIKNPSGIEGNESGKALKKCS